MNLSSRLGVGSSADGPLLYGRSFARIDVSKVFSLTVGAEGRMFLVGTGVQSSSASAIQTMLSGIYGLQVRF